MKKRIRHEKKVHAAIKYTTSTRVPKGYLSFSSFVKIMHKSKNRKYLDYFNVNSNVNSTDAAKANSPSIKEESKYLTLEQLQNKMHKSCRPRKIAAHHRFKRHKKYFHGHKY